MSTKNDVQVIINGKVYTLSGSESEAYLQKVASYINSKFNEFEKLDSYRKLNSDYQGILLALNIADDLFKEQEKNQRLETSISKVEKRAFDIKHDAIEVRIQLDTAQKLVEEYKVKIGELQKQLINLEIESDNND